MDNVIDLEARRTALRLVRDSEQVSRFYGSTVQLMSALSVTLSTSQELIQKLPPGITRYELEFQCARLRLAVDELQRFASSQVALTESLQAKAPNCDPSNVA